MASPDQAATEASAAAAYNYETFSRSESVGKSDEFRGRLRAGDEAPDFELPTLEGVRLKASYTEKINYVPAEYAGGLRERVFNRAGPRAWEDYQRVFAPGS